MAIIPGKAREMSEALLSDGRVRALSFTGSTEVGKELMVLAAKHVTKLGLELGGHAPFLVFDDANIDLAVAGALGSKFRNAGQTCICANRIYVQSGIHDRFVEALAAKTAQLKVGDGFARGRGHRAARGRPRGGQGGGARRGRRGERRHGSRSAATGSPPATGTRTGSTRPP